MNSNKDIDLTDKADNETAFRNAISCAWLS